MVTTVRCEHHTVFHFLCHLEVLTQLYVPLLGAHVLVCTEDYTAYKQLQTHVAQIRFICLYVTSIQQIKMQKSDFFQLRPRPLSYMVLNPMHI